MAGCQLEEYSDRDISTWHLRYRGLGFESGICNDLECQGMFVLQGDFRFASCAVLGVSVEQERNASRILKKARKYSRSGRSETRDRGSGHGDCLVKDNNQKKGKQEKMDKTATFKESISENT